jgi:hypothetical protein
MSKSIEQNAKQIIDQVMQESAHVLADESSLLKESEKYAWISDRLISIENS